MSIRNLTNNRHKKYLLIVGLALFAQNAALTAAQAQELAAPVASSSSSSTPAVLLESSDSVAQPAVSSTASPAAAPQSASVVLTKPPEAPFPIGNKFSRGLQRITGVNYVTSAIAGSIASAALRHKLGGKVKVHVQTFSLTDLIAGKVKSVSVKTEGSHFKGVPLGHLSASSTTPIWFDYRRGTAHTHGLNTPVMLTVKAEFNQQHVCNALAAEAVIKSMRGLKLDLPGLGEQQLQIIEPKVTLTNESIQIHSLLVTEGASPDTGIDLDISAKPKLSGSKIILENIKVSCPEIEDPKAFAKFAEDLFNPIVDFGRFDRSNMAFRLTAFELQSDKIIGDGNLLLVPKPSNKPANPDNSQNPSKLAHNSKQAK